MVITHNFPSCLTDFPLYFNFAYLRIYSDLKVDSNVSKILWPNCNLGRSKITYFNNYFGLSYSSKYSITII